MRLAHPECKQANSSGIAERSLLGGATTDGQFGANFGLAGYGSPQARMSDVAIRASHQDADPTPNRSGTSSEYTALDR